MEINLTCPRTVGKTIAFDLCYLLAICIHKRLLFIIIVFLLSPSSICGFLQAYFSVLFPFSCHLMSCEWGCHIVAQP